MLSQNLKTHKYTKKSFERNILFPTTLIPQNLQGKKWGEGRGTQKIGLDFIPP